MRFILSFVFILAAATPVRACMIGGPMPSQAELVSLKKLDTQIEEENKVKTAIDAAVWGVVLDTSADRTIQNRTLKFRVEDVYKGDIGGDIFIFTDRHDIISAGEIYHLNLRQIDKNLWTDIGIPQIKYDWYELACQLKPKSTRCQIYQARQFHIKNRCIPFIEQMFSGCFGINQFPKVCKPYYEIANQNPKAFFDSY